MNEKSMIPSIRFAGFTDAWERRKLGDLAEFNKGAGYSKADIQPEGTPLILYGRLYTKYQTIIREIDTFAVPKSGSMYSKGGEVIVPASGETAEDISIASVVAKSGVMIGGDLNIVLPYQVLDPAFLAYSITYGEPHFKLSQYAQGKSVVHIHNADIKAVDIPFPKIQEQESICRLLDMFDRIIALHQRKYEKLVNIKKSMLDKMFPKNGELFPEVRFTGFADAWEQRKLGEISNTYSGGTPAVGNKEFYVGQIPFIRSGEIHSSTTELFINNKALDNSSAKLVKTGDILYALYGATSGEVSRSQIDGAINQAILAIIPSSEHDADFLVEWLRKEKKNIISTYLQGGQGNLSAQIVNELVIPSTTHKEQLKIGHIFREINTLITLHQRKLEKLQNIKKACLEKMFV